MIHAANATYRSLAEFITAQNKEQKAARLKRRRELIEMFG